MQAVIQAPTAPGSHFACMAMEGSTSSSADKKRNKLGYHRTSIACGHCRRRKIRCLVARGDQSGRCENCIRLKKHCQFFSVDQQPTDKRDDADSKTDLSSVGATTPPLMDQKDSYFQYATLPTHPQSGMSHYDPAQVGQPARPTLSSDPMMAHDLGAGAAAPPPLNQQPVSWEDPSLYDHRIPPGVTVEPSMNAPPVHAAAWTQDQASTTASLTTTPQVPSNAPVGMIPPAHPLQSTPTYSAGQEGTGRRIWNPQGGRPMPLQQGVPDAANVQYPSQLAPPVNSNFKRPMNTTTLAEGYPVSMTPPIAVPPSSIPVSYDNQPPPVGFTSWSNNPPPSAPGILPNQRQPESSVPGWYPAGHPQYTQMKHEELAMLSSQGHLVDPNMLQQQPRNPG